MKIKRGLRYCTVLGMVFVVVGVAGIVGSRVAENVKGANAQEGEQTDYLSEQEEIDYGAILGEVEGGSEYQYPNIEASVIEELEDFPEAYDLRDEYAVRQKNQNTEGMCWMYSGVTALEYSLAKKYENYEVSVKHLDYMAIDGRYVYKQTDKTNVYFDRYINGGGFHRWSLGTSGASEEVIYGVLNPLAIMSESDFTNVLKENDSRLAGINRYEDIWSLADKGNILEDNDEGYPSYVEKQDYYKVNDPTKVKYVVTGAKMAGYSFDASRMADSDEVKAIKSIISNYGAIRVSTFGTSDKFNNCSDKKIINGRDKYTFIVDRRVEREDPNDPESKILYECKANHGMTIVGWDDNWEYNYNGEAKSGAFILQNSWGEDEEDKTKWRLSYTSDLPDLMYFDSVERYDDYDHYYGVEDYRERTISPTNDEYIFEFSLDNNEEIKAFVFSEIRDLAHEYDVYVSDTGREDDFEWDGRYTFGPGITKYEFNRNYEIAGDYAIKMKRADGTAVLVNNRIRGTANVLADKVWALELTGNGGDNEKLTCRVKDGYCSVEIPAEVPVRTGYYFMGYADTADATAAKYQPGGSITLSSDKTIFAVWAVDYEYIVENYDVITEGDRNYMDLTDFYENVGEFDKIFSDNGVDVFTLEIDYKELDSNQVLYTSGKTKLYKNNNLQATYTNVIRGDTNGDGDIGIRDYIEIKKDIMDTGKLQNEYRLAGDVNKNDRVDIQDYIEVKKQIMNET